MATFIVMQQGGTSGEWYTHAHDSKADADADIKSCAKGDYPTLGPFELPDSPSPEDYFELLEEVAAGAATL